MKLAGTGHRPDKLGGWDVPAAHGRVIDLGLAVLEQLEPSEVMSGMACGWDMALAEAAVMKGVPFVAAIPFEGQESRWSSFYQKQYRRLLGEASRVENVSGLTNETLTRKGAVRCLFRRNGHMLDYLNESFLAVACY